MPADPRRTPSPVPIPILLASVLAAASLASGCGARLAATPPAPAAALAAGPVTLEGVLVDSYCYSIDPAHKGTDHGTSSGAIEGCAQACARLGIPVALVTGSGEVVLLLAPAPDLADHMGRSARATGVRAFSGALRPDSIWTRDDGGAWTPVSLHRMM